MKTINDFLKILNDEKIYEILNSKNDLLSLSNNDFNQLFLKSVELGSKKIVDFFLSDFDFLPKIDFFMISLIIK